MRAQPENSHRGCGPKKFRQNANRMEKLFLYGVAAYGILGNFEYVQEVAAVPFI